MSSETETGFTKIFYDRRLQDYWIKRLVAIVIDAVLIGVATLIFELVIFFATALSTNATFGIPWWGMNSWVFSFSAGIPLFLYSALTEYYYGFTLGKRIMMSKVVWGEGKKPPVNVAFLRNATKIFWLALLLDIVVVLAMSTREPTQKYTDTFAGTMVITVD